MPKGKKKKGKKKKKEFDPPVYQIPEFEDPETMYPRADLVLRLATLLIPEEHMTLRMNVPVNTRVAEVVRAVLQHHQGAVRGVKVCLEKYSAEEALPHDKKLMECGVASEGQFKLFYDFVPVTYPVLL